MVEINKAYAENVSFRRIATVFGGSEATARRHEEHIAELLSKHATEADKVAARAVRDRLQSLCDETEEVLHTERAKIDPNTFAILAAIRELRAGLDKYGEYSGEKPKQEGATTNVQVNTVNFDTAPLLHKALKAVPCECGRTVDARAWVLKVLRGE